MQDIVNLLRLTKRDGLRSVFMHKAADEIELLRKQLSATTRDKKLLRDMLTRVMTDYDESAVPTSMNFEWCWDARRLLDKLKEDDLV